MNSIKNNNNKSLHKDTAPIEKTNQPLENFQEVRQIMLKYEENLSPYAALDKDAKRLSPLTLDIRSNYSRDGDRILNSLAYTRYMNKTQVFTNYHNDHISTRLIHVGLVNKIARTIGKALSLNEELIEAISLGHDVGHVPYGHTGEAILNDISLKYDQTYFHHNVQSVREFMTLENKNLTVQVLDGILAHNGEILSNIYQYKPKTPEEFLEEYHSCYHDKDASKKILPMTLEGCVVKISDIIGYIGRDLEDALRIGVIKRTDIPSNIATTLGNTNSQIVNTLILDIITHSRGQDHLELSNPVFQALQELINFNYKYIYIPAHSKEQIETYTIMFNELFLYYRDNLTNPKCSIYHSFLKYKNSDYLNTTNDNRKVIDFIAGMTDRYIETEYQKYLQLKDRNVTKC